MKPGNKTIGHPVNVATGDVSQTAVDTEIPGKIPIKWERRYSTSLLKVPPGPLGPGWAVSYFSTLTVEQGGVTLVTPAGDLERFDDPANRLARGEKLVHYGSFQELEKHGSEYWLTQWDVSTSDVIRFVYGAIPESEAACRLIRVENATGQALDLGWNAFGHLVSVRQRVEGRFLSFTYSQTGQLETITASSSRGSTRVVATYEYDDLRRLVRSTDSIHRHHGYVYDEHSRLTKEVLKDGGVFSFQYDERGRCLRTSGLDNYDAKTFRYLDSIRLTRVTDSRGYTTTYQSLASGQVVSEVNALGAREETDYDEEGRIVKLVDPNGGVTVYEYDDRGNRTKVTDTAGSVTEWRYNDLHQPIEFTDRAGLLWIRKYDDRGNWVTAVDPEQNEWRFAYNSASQLTSIIDSNSNSRRILYGPDGVLSASTDWMGRRTEFTFDPFGRLIGQKDPDGALTTITRDNADRIIAIRTRQSGEVCYQYDDGDNLTSIVDQAGRARRFRYATCGRLVEETNSRGHTVRYSWGTEPAHLEEITNENGETYVLEYDEVGRVKKRVTFDGRVLEREFDPAGKCVAEYRNSEASVSYVYDEAGRMVERQSSDGLARFAYDQSGRLASAENEHIRIDVERDYRGRVVCERQGTHVLSYRYDPLGRMIQFETSLGHQVTYEHDANGTLRRIQTADGDELSFEMDDMGRETKRSFPGGLELWQQYNLRGQLIRQDLARPGDTPAGSMLSAAPSRDAMVSREYEYDITGALTGVADQFWGKQSYEYDSERRLTFLGRKEGVERFTYDPAGNRVTVMRTGEGMQETTYSAGNLLQSQGDFQFEYDDFGRQVKKTRAREGEAPAQWVFHWNATDQIVAVDVPGGKRWEYKYDPFGRRIRKIGPDCLVEFVWDGFDVVHEVTNGKKRSWIHDEESYKLLAQIDASEFYGVITDHLGTPRELVDRTGAVQWRSNHWAWGERLDSGEATATDCPWGFPGQYIDGESGLYYSCYRYYDPIQGRFLSQDPFEILGGLNEYSYCTNPVNGIDPLGLTECGDDDDGEYVYQLKKDDEVIYYGITNDPKRRVGEHANGKPPNTPPKDFDTMEVLTDKVSHNDARNLEAKLIRDRIESEGVDTNQSVKDQLSDAGLLNKNRGRDTNEAEKRGSPFGDESLIKDEADRTTHDNPNK